PISDGNLFAPRHKSSVETGLAPSPACSATNVAVGPRHGKPRLYRKSNTVLLPRRAVLPNIWLPRSGRCRQVLQRLSCRFLLGPFLGRALLPPHKLPHLSRRQSHFDRKRLLVFGAFLFHQRINRL